MYSLSDYDYELPETLIAQYPVQQRDRSRLLYLNRKTGACSHHRFHEIIDFLKPTDLMVVNNTEVIPARLKGRKETGGKAEVLLLDYADGLKKATDNGRCVCRCLVKASKRPKIGTFLDFGPELRAEILDFNDGLFTLKFICNTDFEDLLYRIGTVPLPPYIRRESGHAAPCDDHNTYQTVYASRKGAVAAPTAGLHFSKELLGQIRSKGVQLIEITLHVGYGTFLPVRVRDIRNHQMHGERYTVGRYEAEAISRAKRQGRRVIAVGTTCVRTLEHVSDADGRVTAGSGRSDLFIYPGYRFKVVDAMITNFHLPRSTLLMLVSAFAGREKVLSAYREAIHENYRFFSYGDAMLIA